MRILHTILAAAAATVLIACDHQHPKGSLSVSKDVIVSASPDQVWELIGDFNGVHHWLPAIKSSQISGAKTPTRMLFLGDGGIIREELLDYDDGESYRYQIIDSPLPLENYVSTLAVEPHEGGSRIIWRGDFDPAAGTSDAEAVELVNGIYQSGLDSISAKMGG